MALGALAALLCIAYGNVIFGGRSLVYSNAMNPLDVRFTARNYGENFVSPAEWESRNLLFTANFHDVGGPMWQWEPDARFARASLLAGELPLWNPYVGAGAPELTNLAPALLFPPYLGMVLLGNTVGLRNVYQLAVVLSAGLFTFLFLRGEGLLRRSSLFGAAAFMFCGAVTQNVGSFLGQTVAMLPFTLYLTRLFLERPTGRRAALLAAGYGCAALASFPPVLLACFGFCVIYAIATVAVDSRAADAADAGPWEVTRLRLRRLVAFAAAAVLGIGLVAFYYLPALALDHATPQVARAYANAAARTVRPVCLLQLISPTLFGAGEILRSQPMGEPMDIHVAYAGWIPLLVGGLALGRPRGRNTALWAAACLAGVLVSMKLLGVPPVQWIAKLPMLAHIHMAHYFGYLLDFVVALLAALGLDRISRGGVSPRACLAVGGAALALLLSLLPVARGAGVFARPWAEQWLHEWGLLAVLAGLATAVVWLLARRARAGLTPVGPAVLLLALFLVEAVAHTYYPRPKAHDIWAAPPDYVTKLAGSGGGRVFTAGALPANSGSVYGIAQLDSLLSYNSPRVFELYRRYVNPWSETFLRDARQLPPEGVLDGAAIEFIVISRERAELGREADRRGYPLFFSDELVSIYRRPGAEPYFFTSDYRVLPAEDALLELGARSPTRTTLLETPPSFPASPNPTEGASGGPHIELIGRGNNSYRLRVNAPRAGLVYAAESLLPGWTASVNGVPAAIRPANYAFRAVEVPAGVSEIELRYWPPGFTAGLTATGASLALLVFLLLRPQHLSPNREPLPE